MLKVWSGFFLLLILKCYIKEMEELLRKERERLKTWWCGKFQLIQIAEKLTLGNSLSQKCALEWKPSVAGQPVLAPRKYQELRVSAHTEGSLKWLVVWLTDPLSLLSRSQNRTCNFPGGAPCLIEGIPVIDTWDSWVFGRVIPAETLTICTERDKEDKMKKACQTPKKL